MDTPYEGFHLLLEASKIMDAGNGESKGKLIKLCCLIKSQDDLCNEIDIYIVNLFVKIRFFNRIKILNNKEPLVLILILSTRG